MATNPYNLNSGMRCVKYMLLIINFLFMLTSILLILVGTTIQTIFFDFRQFIDSHFASPPALLVAVGAIMLIVSLFGCFGALKESTLLINLYGVLLLTIFILEISAAIAAFALGHQVHGMLIRTMTESLQKYKVNSYYAEGVDFMQTSLQCCGVSSPNDWAGILAPVDQTNQTMPYDIVLPMSCCANTNITSENIVSCDYNDIGCLNRMDFIISQSSMLLATGAITVAFVQLLGVVCAFMLAKTIRRTKSMRAVRRWQLQQSLGILATGGKNLTEDSGYTQLEKSPEVITYTTKSPSIN